MRKRTVECERDLSPIVAVVDHGQSVLSFFDRMSGDECDKGSQGEEEAGPHDEEEVVRQVVAGRERRERVMMGVLREIG